MWRGPHLALCGLKAGHPPTSLTPLPCLPLLTLGSTPFSLPSSPSLPSSFSFLFTTFLIINVTPFPLLSDAPVAPVHYLFRSMVTHTYTIHTHTCTRTHTPTHAHDHTHTHTYTYTHTHHARNHHWPPATTRITHHHQSPTITINHHQSLSITINQHQSPSITINHQQSPCHYRSPVPLTLAILIAPHHPHHQGERVCHV